MVLWKSVYTKINKYDCDMFDHFFPINSLEELLMIDIILH